MRTIELSYALRGVAGPPGAIHNPLIELLQAVREQGSIGGAANALGRSYRHVWGELKRWEGELGRTLIVWDKGQPARLTEFGDKLLWAERQAQARLAPQIEALHADLERAFAVAFDDGAHVLTMHASHDDALASLRSFAAAHARLHLDVRFMGSVDAIASLNAGRCTVAGFHTPPQPAPGSLAERTYRPLLQPGRHKIIGFARRMPGAGRGARQSAAAALARGPGAHGRALRQSRRRAPAPGCWPTTCCERAGLAPAQHPGLGPRGALACGGRAGRGLGQRGRGPGHRGGGAHPRPGLRRR